MSFADSSLLGALAHRKQRAYDIETNKCTFVGLVSYITAQYAAMDHIKLMQCALQVLHVCPSV